jgi:hypothetical protein
MLNEETSAAVQSYPKILTIELLALDLETCERCTGTDANIQEALESVAGVLQEAGAEANVRKVVVKTAAQAEQLRFRSSPTIRINGRDIAMDLRESQCDDCGELCGCNGNVKCRVWVWQGREHLEAPKAMIINAILKAYARSDEPSADPSQPFRLPENLQKYFAASAFKSPQRRTADECCDRNSCCEPTQKSKCSGLKVQSATCGCK